MEKATQAFAEKTVAEKLEEIRKSLPLIYERDDEFLAGGGLEVFATTRPYNLRPGEMIPIHMHRDEEECRRAVRILANVVGVAAFAIWAVALTWWLLMLLGRF